MARSCGYKKDLRIQKNTKYGFYKYININSYFSYNSDNYSRYILRIYEIYESLNIINIVCQNLLENFKKNIFVKNYVTMEKTINHFKI